MNTIILQNTKNIDHVRFNLTLVRHAATHANAAGTIQGLIDTELSNIGHLQSQALGQYLQYHRFSHIYSSDLKRAAETARQIRAFNRVSSCKIQYDPLLRERMYGIAEGRTRQWLRELAKESGIPYINFTPPGAESTAQVRERVIKFFRNLCHELLKNSRTNLSVKFYIPNSLSQENNEQSLLRSISSENFISSQQTITNLIRKRSLSTGNIQIKLITNMIKTTSYQSSSFDSALDLLSVSSDQQSITSSISLLSRRSSFEKQQNLSKNLLHSSYKNNFSDFDILIVTHGAIIREFIKYFVYDLQVDIGQYLDTIQDIAPNTSITRFKVTYSINDDLNSMTTIKLIDYHNKTHLINSNNDKYNLDVVNKCSL
ncbi:unnamed protein product [Rotaria sordida]|uniref:Fructose-2,6-bisphosphatase n=1 Tax=Rotaria sordida TaxID=392033 RepID=A0A813ZRF3_9BILA|nr:unnamed protein product [Rotaria sordida]CAF3611591.1 unnamed protein product [Rotaria sordida]